MLHVCMVNQFWQPPLWIPYSWSCLLPPSRFWWMDNYKQIMAYPGSVNSLLKSSISQIKTHVPLLYGVFEFILSMSFSSLHQWLIAIMYQHAFLMYTKSQPTCLSILSLAVLVMSYHRLSNNKLLLSLCELPNHNEIRILILYILQQRWGLEVDERIKAISTDPFCTRPLFTSYSVSGQEVLSRSKTPWSGILI